MKKEGVSRMGLKKRAGSFFAAALLSFALLPTLTAQPYPRIANLYGAGLSWMNPAEGMPYWSRLGMIVGGGSFHNDYEDKDMLSSAEQGARTAVLLRKTRPEIIILPYVNVLYGTKYGNLPADFWAKGTDGNRVSPWPGYWSVDASRQDVLAHTAGFIKTAIFANAAWDGVFLDCWAPDAYLVPAIRAASKDRFIIANTGRFSSEVSPLVNGTMSEDELNEAASGLLNFSNLVDRYLRWCGESAKPALSIISCHPRTIDTDPWLWAKKTVAERQAILEKESRADLPMMRFGLCFTLLGEGFFAYDGGPQDRGSHWWYPEYDVPLGQPLANAISIDPDVWERDFRGGKVIVNGSTYDESVTFPGNMKDVSTGRVASRQGDLLPERFRGRRHGGLPGRTGEMAIPQRA